MVNKLTNWKVAFILIFFAGLLAYHNSFFGEFVFDDWSTINITRSWQSVYDVWNSSPKRFIPNLTFYFNYKIGLTNIVGYHIVNFLIHTLNGCLVFVLINFLTNGKNKLLALFTSLIFVVHPIQTQAVTYISQRYASLAATFYLLTIVTFTKWLHKKNIWLLFFSILFCLFAFFTKENTLTLPVSLCFVYYFTQVNKLKINKVISNLLPFFVLAILFILIIFLKPTGLDIGKSLEVARHGKNISSGAYFLTQINVIRTYIRLLVLPISQNIDYDYPVFKTLLNLSTVSSLFLIMSLIISSIKLRKKVPLFFFSVMFFFITLAVESSFIPIADVIFEHRLYLPSIGFFIAFSSLLQYFFKDISNKRILFLISAFIILVLALGTILRNRVWQTEVGLWRDTIIKSPNKARVHYNLGVSYGNIGDFDAAQSEFEYTLKLDPQYADAYLNLGGIYEYKKDYNKALQYYLQANLLDPTNEIAKSRIDGLKPKIGSN